MHDERPAGAPFPIVGIGASAGGLVALEQFLAQVPLNSGMAYVIVQHLDPHREGMLVELLQRHAPIPIVQVSDPMPVEPDHGYVIPPGRDLAILQGVLHLQQPAELRGLRLPIDFFFKSLAQERQQNSIGVILSGMGSDGTLGLRAIRQAAGACFVQSPASAEFDSMPRSAIDAGVADVVAPADELPGKILAYASRVQLGAQAETEAEVDQKDAGFLDQVIALLRTQSGHDFSQYKKSTLARRIERRMALHQLVRLGDYLRYLRENPQESEMLFNELLIGVTSFFRDAAVWEQLKSEVLPALLASHPQGAALRAWVAGCASGEEAFSLAMIFREFLEDAKPSQRYSLQIFASDLDKDAIATARAGVYPRGAGVDVPDQRLKRFFVENAGGYRVCNEIREMVIFAEQNIIVDPPFIKMDLLSCRNLLIYLEPELQAKLIQLFNYSLNPGGFLMLGSAESIGTSTGLFFPMSGKTRIYRRLEAPVRALPLGFPAAFAKNYSRVASAASGSVPGAAACAADLQFWVERLVLQHYAPAAVLVTAQGDMLYLSGNTGKYLEPARGRPTLNLFSMARDGLGQSLSEVFHRAVREKTVATLKNVKVKGEGAMQHVNIVVHPLEDPVALRGRALIVFSDVAAPRPRRARNAAGTVAGDGAQLEAIARELQQSREETTSTREQMQTSQEELKSSNEELQSANEELQSTNEEMTTSKEEMQSMNEELQTVNRELQAKVSELSRASNDMRNLLDSTEIATLFLDEALNVRRFTAPTTRIIKLIAADKGRPITDIVTDLNYPEMASDAREVLRSLVFREKDVPALGGLWFKVRIMPYRTQENRIDGLVITFSDITQGKRLEAELLATQARLKAMLESSTHQGVADGLS